MTTQLLTYRITLDTFKNGIQRVLQGFQTGENISRRIEISLTSGTDSYVFPSNNITASMYVKRPSQTDPSINACTIDSTTNKIIYDVTEEDISEAGTVQLQLKLIDSTSGSAVTLISPLFAMEVWESEVSDSTAEGTTTYTALTDALAAATAVSQAKLTEFVIDDDNIIKVTFADGTVYTSTVIADALKEISDIEGYVEEAKEAAESATTSKTEASTSEANAKTSETNAKTSETNAKTSEDNAKASETNASTSEANALAYKNASATSEANAKTSETNASTSESNAKTSETNAKTSESNAKAYEGNASTYADNAKKSAESVAGLETLAEEYSVVSKSYAVGGTSTRTGEDNDNAKYYKEQCEQIAGGLSGGFIPMGTILFASLPAAPSVGYMYNISDEFTTDSRFKDGAGKTYAAGTNVYYTADGLWDCLSGSVPTVNGKNGNSITLDGGDILVTGYSKATSEEAIANTDSINTALGKLEKKADGVESKISTAVANLGEILDYKGTVATLDDLPANPSAGDVYHVTSENANYAYEVEPDTKVGAWSQLGSTVDLSNYYTKDETADAIKSNTVELSETEYEALPETKESDGKDYLVDEETEDLDATLIPYGTSNVGAALDSLNSKLTELDELIVEKEYDVTNLSVSANSYAVISSIELSGYVPMSSLFLADDATNVIHSAIIGRVTSGSTTHTYQVQLVNTWSNAITVNGKAKVWWIKA